MSLEHFSQVHSAPRAAVLGAALDEATTQYLLQNKSPSRKVNELDNRGSHFYVAKFWAEALAAQSDDEALKTRFAEVAKHCDAEETIVTELNDAGCRGRHQGLLAQPRARAVAMRPSATLNALIDAI